MRKNSGQEQALASRDLCIEEIDFKPPPACVQIKSSNVWNSLGPPGNWNKGKWQLGNRMWNAHSTHLYPNSVTESKSSERMNSLTFWDCFFMSCFKKMFFHFHFSNSLTTKKFLQSPKCQLGILFGIPGSQIKNGIPRKLYILFLSQF